MPHRSKLLLVLVFAAGLFTSCSYRFYQTDCDYPLPGNMAKKYTLDSSVPETSGLVFIEGRIWTFNDSGGEAALYCLDAADGSLIRKTIIRNAVNVDWEDICEDDSYLYVADVGNNYASRDTLIIYRIPRGALLTEQPEAIHDGIISLSFGGKVLRTRAGLSSHDCEALVAYGDSLYLFSKDWVEKTTSVYVLPKYPGHYTLSPVITYQAGFLVTGADVFPGNRQVSLVGYNNYIPVLVSYEFEDSPAGISCGGKARVYPLRLGRQVEGICYNPGGELFISAELSLKKQALFTVGSRVR